MTIIEDKELRKVPDKIDNQNLCVIDPTVQPTSSDEKKNKTIATEEARSACSLHGNDATQAVLLAVSIFFYSSVLGNILFSLQMVI